MLVFVCPAFVGLFLGLFGFYPLLEDKDIVILE